MDTLQTRETAALSDEKFAAYLDVDFAEHARKMRRLMGATPRLESAGMAGAPLYADVMPLVDESQWKAMIEAKNAGGGMLQPLIRHVKDQNGEPSCVSNATLSGHEIKQLELFGAENLTILSPISLYMRVGSPRSGSSLSSNLREMNETGALPQSNSPNASKFKHTMPANGYGTKYPTGWQETAGQFKFAETADIESCKEFVSALLNGHPVVYARSGHCILAVGLIYRNGALYLVYLNSWSSSWGAPINEHFEGGAGFDSERVGKSAAYGAFAVLNVQLPSIVTIPTAPTLALSA
jgi:hypothetical protein